MSALKEISPAENEQICDGEKNKNLESSEVIEGEQQQLLLDQSKSEETKAVKHKLECDDESLPSKKTYRDDTEDEELFNGVKISELTKSQMKKYQRMLKWQVLKKEKRAKEKVKTKNKKIEAKLNNIDLGPSRKQLKNSRMKDSACKVGIIIDLSFDHLMIDKDIGKAIKQILRIYTINRRSKSPMQLHVTSFTGKSKDEMAKHVGYENWDVNFYTEDYLKVFPKHRLVYLSSESDNVVKELQDDKIYIIGGLVDHNSHKGICYKKAVEQGIEHAQLPITDFFNIKTRKVFTINQVFEIILKVSEGESFKEAFESVLPKRINMEPNKEDTQD